MEPLEKQLEEEDDDHEDEGNIIKILKYNVSVDSESYQNNLGCLTCLLSESPFNFYHYAFTLDLDCIMID